MSEPQNSGALAVEMAGLDVIPESDRKGKPSDLFMPWFAANISVLGISWGSWVLGFGLSLAQAVVVSVVGVALSFLVCGLIAIAGKRGSAPTLVLSRAAFGFNGNRISAAISWILTVGWETFLAIMAVQATATVMGALGFTNHVVAQIIALVLVVVLAAGSGILGFEAIMKVQTWITWATAALTIVYLVLVAPTIDFAVLSSRPSAPLTAVLGAGCMLLVGFGFGWINAAADYSRYLPRAASTKGVVGWTTVGAALPTVIRPTSLSPRRSVMIRSVRSPRCCPPGSSFPSRWLRFWASSAASSWTSTPRACRCWPRACPSPARSPPPLTARS